MPDDNTTKFVSMPHQPVMVSEVLAYLGVTPGKTYVDGTLGAGGHANAILEQLEGSGQLIGADQDPVALALARTRLEEYADQCVFLQTNFSMLVDELSRQHLLPITGGILLDLGVSSMQLDEAERGFSFRQAAPLDMRMDACNPLTAKEVLNTYAEKELVRIFSEYGEERLSKTLAREIVALRKTTPFETTQDLADFVERTYHKTLGKPAKRSRTHPATKVFQAIRIAVNDELGHLERFLESLPTLLAPGARVVVLSFHSLEDRIVKNAFRDYRMVDVPVLNVLTKKPVTPGEVEIDMNPRSRSTKLRAAERIKY
ncbi:MAG: 16S rRNA (cytosine(1402)-N(4))-methyltransferase RsmH [Vampirovibrio sp.]|nr:16S rRNA (cytosine(1402)-N(4))-methyltransferase RsmH [Vampirovibrio sp.]